jgi:hypothetical protein
MLKQEKTKIIKQNTMPTVLLSFLWPAIPLVNKFLISFCIPESGFLLIVVRSRHAQALCSHQSFLSHMLTALPLYPFLLSRLVGLDFIVTDSSVGT